MRMKLHIQYIRIFAILMVMLNHSDFCLSYYRNTDNIVTFFVSLFITCICGIGVPLFFMITGALLIPKQESIEIIVKKRVSKIIIVLIVFSFILYNVLYFWGNKEEIRYSLSDFVQRLVTGNIQTSYWFLYEYIAILLSLPFLSILARNISDELMKYLGKLAIVFLTIIPMVTYWMKDDLPINIPLITTSMFYVVVGYYIENKISDKRLNEISYMKLLGVIVGSIIIPVSYVLIEARISGEMKGNPSGITSALIAVCTYLAIKKWNSKKIVSERWKRIIIEMGQCVFGVYLIERIGQKMFLKLYLYLCNKTFGVIACSIYVMSIYVFCFVMVYFLR